MREQTNCLRACEKVRATRSLVLASLQNGTGARESNLAMFPLPFPPQPSVSMRRCLRPLVCRLFFFFFFLRLRRVRWPLFPSFCVCRSIRHPFVKWRFCCVHVRPYFEEIRSSLRKKKISGWNEVNFNESFRKL